MLKHGRAGVPMEVMGLMLGEFVDDYSGNRFFNCVKRSLLSSRVLGLSRPSD
jgi:proteasome lid subunit RPN8/RPN11